MESAELVDLVLVLPANLDLVAPLLLRLGQLETACQFAVRFFGLKIRELTMRRPSSPDMIAVR
jgi:hypothetical protein